MASARDSGFSRHMPKSSHSHHAACARNCFKLNLSPSGQSAHSCQCVLGLMRSKPKRDRGNETEVRKKLVLSRITMPPNSVFCKLAGGSWLQQRLRPNPAYNLCLGSSDEGKWVKQEEFRTCSCEQEIASLLPVLPVNCAGPKPIH